MTRNFKRFLLLALVLVPMFFLASCKPNANPEKAADALEDKDYAVTLIDDEDMLKYSGMDGLKAVLTAFNEDDEAIMIYYFDSAKDAKEAWEDFEDDIEEMKEEAEEADKKVVAKRSGKMIYVGTKQAVKDAR
mgnify:CR=1 FL=1